MCPVLVAHIELSFQETGASGVTAQQGDAQLGEVENLEDFAYSPAPRGVTVKCRVTRDKKGMDRGLFPTYYMHLEKEENRKVRAHPFSSSARDKTSCLLSKWGSIKPYLKPELLPRGQGCYRN